VDILIFNFFKQSRVGASLRIGRWILISVSRI
jgi:hypothetical protein